MTARGGPPVLTDRGMTLEVAAQILGQANSATVKLNPLDASPEASGDLFGVAGVCSGRAAKSKNCWSPTRPRRSAAAPARTARASR
jgi:hypothetical protein